MSNNLASRRAIALFSLLATLPLSSCARDAAEQQAPPAVTVPPVSIPNPGTSPDVSRLDRVPADSVMVLPAERAPADYFQVTAGDTLDAIAERLNISAARLAKANGIDDPNVIQPGQFLFIPSAR